MGSYGVFWKWEEVKGVRMCVREKGKNCERRKKSPGKEEVRRK